MHNLCCCPRQTNDKNDAANDVANAVPKAATMSSGCKGEVVVFQDHLRKYVCCLCCCSKQLAPMSWVGRCIKPQQQQNRFSG